MSDTIIVFIYIIYVGVYPGMFVAQFPAVSNVLEKSIRMGQVSVG